MQASASDLPRTTLTPATGHVDPVAAPPAPPAPPPPASGDPRDWLTARMPLDDGDHPAATHLGYLALTRCHETLERAHARILASPGSEPDAHAVALLGVADQYRKLARTCGQHSMGVLAPPRPADGGKPKR